MKYSMLNITKMLCVLIRKIVTKLLDQDQLKSGDVMLGPQLPIETTIGTILIKLSFSIMKEIWLNLNSTFKLEWAINNHQDGQVPIISHLKN